MGFVLGSTKSILVAAGVCVAIFVIAFLIGYNVVGEQPQGQEGQIDLPGTEYRLINGKSEILDAGNKRLTSDYLSEQLLSRINTQNLGENLRYLSQKPHLAATPRDEELARFIRDRWAADKFDSSELVAQNYLLSRPDPSNPNKVTLRQRGLTIFESRHKEEAIHQDDDDPNFVHAFNAYTPAGTVSSEPGTGVVYVNYGRIEDFQMLEKLGTNVTGKIVMVKYGKIYRGNKVAHAHKFGAIGVIIFSDPQDVAAEGTSPADVYDKTWWLPSYGISRGSTYLGYGDPLTPGWPSTDSAYRIKIEDSDLPKIPMQPIGYADAEQILMRLGGDVAPVDWQGGLDIKYRLGPKFRPEDSETSLTLSSHNSEKIYKSYNVIGIIKGSIEPDRYVLIGNHRDAWGYGAVDPSSGTAQLLETSRVFGTLLSEGWRPRRTIVFCSWGSEEYGLIGSTEWVEEHVHKLQARAIAYLNIDACSSGPKFRLGATPLLWDVFDGITKKVAGVSDSSKTVFDEWLEYSEKVKPDEDIKPFRKTLGAGSDHAPFTFYAGIPAARIIFADDKTKNNISSYPAYHTGYETYYMIEKFIDPGFKIMQACGRVAALFLQQMSESNIIPYSIDRFPLIMLDQLNKFKDADKIREIYPKYDQLLVSVRRFLNATKDFKTRINEDNLSPLQVRAINDQMMKIEQVFILPQGLPGRPAIRNAVFAPSQFDMSRGSAFAGLRDLLYKYDDLNIKDKEKRNKVIMRHISDLTIMTDMAISLLKPVELI